MTSYLKYELAALALFDSYGMQKTPKSKLYELFEEKFISVRNPATNYIIDGSMLMHKVKWQLGEKYLEICDKYAKYILKHYRKNIFVVFDRYNKATTKSSERNQ